MSALELAAVEPVMLPLADIRIDPGLQCRQLGKDNAGNDRIVRQSVVDEYAALIRQGAELPPVTVFVDPKGVHWLASGFHRCAAAAVAQRTEISADVRQGTRRDALLFSASSNADHGFRRTISDKRRSVSLLLADPTWVKRSNEWVAKQAAVSAPFVAKMKVTLNVLSDEPRETADGRVMDTSRIGSKAGLNSDENKSDFSSLVIRFRRLLNGVSEENKSKFGDAVLAILSEPRA